MSTTILEAFLDAGLLPLVGDDDAKLAHLASASDDLLAALRADPSLVLSATLVALDPSSPEDDALLDLSEAMLQKHWRTARAASGHNRPVELLRAILLNALELAGESSARDAAIIWYTGERPISLALPSQEQPLVEALLRRFGEKTERIARDHWLDRRGAAPMILPEVKPSLPTKLSNTLAAKFAAAAGPHDAAGNSPADANPNYPQATAQWVADFGNRAAGATIDALTAAQQQQQRQVTELLNALIEQIEERLTASIDYRIQLLWWRDACYSPRLMRGYRSLDPRLAAIAMSADLANELPPLHPQSVEYFLQESVAALIAKDTTKEDGGGTLTSWAQGLIDLPMAADILALLGATTARPWPSSLLDVTRALLDGRCNAEEVPKRLGVPPDTVLPLPDISVWLFRCIQARRLANPAGPEDEVSFAEVGDDE